MKMNALSLSTLPARVKVCEMGPRDGLQNEAGVVATADKIRYIDLLSASGLALIEATSFVRPDAIPQLNDAEAVMAGIRAPPGVTLSRVSCRTCADSIGRGPPACARSRSSPPPRKASRSATST